MKLALLAPQAAGKTCYLSSLYGELTDLINFTRELAPLNFYFTNTEQDGRLGELYDGLLDGNMPAGTQTLEYFPVRIHHRIKNADTEIELVDFPGGRLRNTGAPDEEIEEIKSSLSLCDAFIILIDGHYAGCAGQIFRSKIAASKINEILNHVVKKKLHSQFALHGIPFIFAISKVDKILHDNKLMINAYSNIFGSFPEFFRTDVDCVSCITQISLGDNIDDAEPTKKRGEYEPKNITLPFFLALGIGTLSGAKYRHSECNHLAQEKERANELYHQERLTYESAKERYERRKNADFTEKVDQFFKSNGTFGFELRKRAERYEIEQLRAHHKWSDECDKLAGKIREIDNLRKVGAAVLHQIRHNTFDGDFPDAVMYWRGKKHRLKNGIDSEVESPLEAL